MCGRFVASSTPAQIAEEFGADVIKASQPEPRFNIAPQSDVEVVVERIDKESGERSRALSMFHWGLVPNWAKDTKIGFKMTNARSETVLEKSTYKRTFTRRRCIIPADGFFEWLRVGEGTKAPKFPYFIHRKDGHALALAGMWEIWHDPTQPEETEPLRSVTIITTDANKLMSNIHTRMPVVLPEVDWDRWLDPQNDDTEGLGQLLTPTPDAWYDMYRVSTAVNNARSSGSELITPLDQMATVPDKDAEAPDWVQMRFTS